VTAGGRTDKKGEEFGWEREDDNAWEQ
jgi:hypothetical protein